MENTSLQVETIVSTKSFKVLSTGTLSAEQRHRVPRFATELEKQYLEKIVAFVGDFRSKNLPEKAEALIEIVFDAQIKTGGLFLHVRPNAIFLHPRVLGLDSSGRTAVRMALHELFHLRHFAWRPKEESWIQEGMATMFEYLCFDGQFSGHQIQAWLKNPGVALRAPMSHEDLNLAQYGKAQLFFVYALASDNAKLKTLWDWAKMGVPERFLTESFFRQFELAMAINRPTTRNTEGIYPYFIFSTSERPTASATATALKKGESQLLELTQMPTESSWQDLLTIWNSDKANTQIYWLDSEFPYEPRLIENSAQIPSAFPMRLLVLGF